MRRPILFGLGLAAIVACEPDPYARSQWIVTLRTDAPLPAVADRVVVEILDDDGNLACSSCRRTLDARAAAWPISFGVAEATRPLTVRARLFDTRLAGVDGLPRGEAAIDARARLPDEPGEVTTSLAMACFALASSPLATCDPATGELGPLPTMASGRGDASFVPGSYAGAKVPPCGAAAARPGERCVDGGIMYMRDIPGASTEKSRGLVQLVRVSSFFLDRTEVTVGRFRQLARAGVVTDEPGRRGAPNTLEQYCTYLGPDDASNDDLPLDCVGFPLASRICEAEGSVLPTEAQLAYAATNGPDGTTYPWGEDENVCLHAIVGRGYNAATIGNGAVSGDCRGVIEPLPAAGPVGVSTPEARADVNASGIFGLAGNMSEWVRDDFARLDDPCWQKRPMLVDPICKNTGNVRMTRGGTWIGPVHVARAAYRDTVRPDLPLIYIGFRCARSL